MTFMKIPYEILKVARLDAYNAALHWYNENREHEQAEEVGLLLSECNLSYESKNELYYKCLELGILEPPKI